MDSIATRRIIHNHCQWMQKCFDDPDIEMFIITFMFHQLPVKNNETRLAIMRSEIERVTSILITRLFRNPNKLSAAQRKFLMVLFPDLPVPKGDKKIFVSTTNDGTHFAGTLIAPKTSRLNVGIDEHVREYSHIYTPKGGRIQEIHFEKIVETPKKAMEYNLKHLRRKSFSYDEMLILPKSISEMDCGSRSRIRVFG